MRRVRAVLFTEDCSFVLYLIAIKNCKGKNNFVMRNVFIKRTAAVILASVLSAGALAGCGVKVMPDLAKAAEKVNSLSVEGVQSTSQQESTAASVQMTSVAATTAAAEETTAAAQTETVQSGGRQIHEPEITDEMRALDNTSYGTGANVSDRNEDNVPNGYLYYQNRWGSTHNAVWLADTSEKTMYLTFDVGYDEGNADKILDTLAEKNVKATFFVTQALVDSEPDTLQRMISEGHTVGNHTISHPSDGEPSLSLEEQVNDILPLEEQVYNDYGYEMRYFRYPEGTFSDQSLALLDAMGFTSVFWSFSYKDWDTANQPDPEEALNEMVSQLHPGAVYLLHAVSDTDTEVLGSLIDAAREQGYTFAAFGNDNRY